MQKTDFNIFVDGIGNDLKIAIDDIIGVIKAIYEDLEKARADISETDKKNRVVEKNK